MSLIQVKQTTKYQNHKMVKSSNIMAFSLELLIKHGTEGTMFI